MSKCLQANPEDPVNTRQPRKFDAWQRTQDEDHQCRLGAREHCDYGLKHAGELVVLVVVSHEASRHSCGGVACKAEQCEQYHCV